MTRTRIRNLACKRALAALAGVLALLAGVGCGDDDNKGSDAAGEPTKPATGEAAGHSVNLGSARLEDGRRIVLHSSSPPGAETGPCLTVLGVDRFKRGCARAPSERFPSRARAAILAEATAQVQASSPLEVYGTTSAATERVGVEFEAGGSVDRVPGTLIPAVDEMALAGAGIDQPFQLFFAELPAAATNIRATALGQGNEALGSVSFNRFEGLHPQAFIPDAP